MKDGIMYKCEMKKRKKKLMFSWNMNNKLNEKNKMEQKLHT